MLSTFHCQLAAKERPSSRKPLRSFGKGRFVDNNLFIANIERYPRLFELDLFSTRVVFEVALFADVGRVCLILGQNLCDENLTRDVGKGYNLVYFSVRVKFYWTRIRLYVI